MGSKISFLLGMKFKKINSKSQIPKKFSKDGLAIIFWIDCCFIIFVTDINNQMKNNLIQFIAVLMICFASFGISYSQKIELGGKIGVSFAFGNKINRLGFIASGYAVRDWLQINSSANFNYTFKSLAIKKSTPEIRLSIGALGGYGFKLENVNNFIGATENNTVFANSIGYTYNRYWDKNGTTQSSGLIAARFNKITIATENDILGAGRGNEDKFRTGGVYLEYQHLDTKLGINTTMWTGNYSKSPLISDTDFPAQNGYRDMKNSVYGNRSASLLSFQIKQLLPFNQTAQLNIGIDDERIRNRLQNQFMHNLKFIPKSWQKTKNFHIPMLTEDGKQYLYKPEQTIKKPTFYFNLGMNNPMFY